MQEEPQSESPNAKPLKNKKHVMKSLKHSGIYVPKYETKGFSIKIRGTTLRLMPKSEQMAVAWIRKRQSAASPPDKVFMRNFMHEFLEQLKQENPALVFLGSFAQEYLAKIEKYTPSDVGNPNAPIHQDIDFAEVASYVEGEKAKKATLSSEDKKKLAADRKAVREQLKAKFAVAEVDGQKLEIANWTAEPSCLFAGRGDHPQRGKWKDGPGEEDIILNLPKDMPVPPGKWKGVVWEPQKMYVAKWEDKLTGKIKYVWFSDTAFLKQNREKAKFQKAEALGKIIKKIEEHILSPRNLESKDENRRKVATVSWLILNQNMRVGDEKDPDEADTVGAITLRAEHIKIEGDTLHFDFLGKDSVRWVKSVKAPPAIIKNIEHFSKTSKEYLFEGIDSKTVSRFLSEKMPGLTAKVFRTWRCTQTVREELEKSGVKKEDPDYQKMFAAKMANLKVAEVANHKRKIPPTFQDRLIKKQEHLKELEAQLQTRKKEGKKTESVQTRLEKAKLDIELTRRTEEYNLGTSLKSYIDPTAYVKWAKKVKFDITKFYPKTLQKKFSWALGGSKSEPECITA
ncbi:MAG TPA: DNA topoisomerase I [Candidatus Nanoarchaeia archaeon]|nr:DNA topoisomerase I [Candidatus Nanoarchaeia archaeon]